MSGMLDELRAFIEEEARLLDQRRFDEWLTLYADDAVYWIPRQRQQTDPLGVPSIVYEDRGLLAMRIARMADPAMHAAHPATHTLHVIGSVAMASAHHEAHDDYRVTSAQLVVASRDGDTRLYAGQCEHWLRHRRGVFAIAQKRIDLIDCDAVHLPISILF